MLVLSISSARGAILSEVKLRTRVAQHVGGVAEIEIEAGIGIGDHEHGSGNDRAIWRRMGWFAKAEPVMRAGIAPIDQGRDRARGRGVFFLATARGPIPARIFRDTGRQRSTPDFTRACIAPSSRLGLRSASGPAAGIAIRHPRRSGSFLSRHTDARKGASLSCMVLRTLRFSAWHLLARVCQWKWGQETCLQELTKRCFPSNPARAAWRTISSVFKALPNISVYGSRRPCQSSVTLLAQKSRKIVIAQGLGCRRRAAPSLRMTGAHAQFHSEPNSQSSVTLLAKNRSPAQSATDLIGPEPRNSGIGIQ